MRLTRGDPAAPSRPSRASPYRVPGEAAPAPAAGRERRVDPMVVAVMVFVLACSLLRFAFFVHGSGRQGPDGVLALAASSASAYYLFRLLLG